MIGRTVGGRYDILERAGEGPVYEAFKGRDRTLDRVVALRSLRQELAADAGVTQTLLRSAAAAQSLAHPNIARVLDVVQGPGSVVVIEEHVRGIDLKERIRRIAPLQPALATDTALAVAEALHCAHAAGIAHGDVRPHHVVLGTDGACKIVGFGFAALALLPAVEATALGDDAAPYRGPEYWTAGAITAASDIYALGVTLYEMLTGALPFPGDSRDAIGRRHLGEMAPSPRTRNAGVPRALETVVARAMAKRPEERYATMAEMAADLKLIRDALRFGRPAPELAPVRQTPLTPPAAPVSASRPAATPARRTLEPLIDVKPIPASEPSAEVSRMRVVVNEDDRVPAFLRYAIGSVVAIIVIGLVLGAALWLTSYSKPQEKPFPDLVGTSLADAQKMATGLGVRLTTREEYNDRYEPGAIYRVDYEGRTIKAGRTVAVWVSKGTRTVWVPDLSGLPAVEAEAKLKDAGLLLGKVDRRASRRVTAGSVIEQDPASGRRVDRDSAVAVVVSDGSDDPVIDGGAPSDTPVSDDPETRRYTIRFEVPTDGAGSRLVRVEYTDLNGSHEALNETHNEGDRIRETVDVAGEELTLNIYFGDDASPAHTQTIRLRPRR
ncbi:MAG: PASTA domain-containing protein [Armatimonadetes bacterium]|nr:PASTA domain-containing protein [Armatimonadota bacterium]